MELVSSRLRSLGYEFSKIRQRLGLPDYRQWDAADAGVSTALDRYLPPISNFLGADPVDALDTVIRLLLLSVPMKKKEAADALGTAAFDALLEMRILKVLADGEIQAQAALWEIDGLFIATDALQVEDPEVNPVMWLLPECFELAAARVPGRHVLDLCTGSGVHALLASRTADEVVGVDISPRAIQFARFNQALNGRDNVTFMEGSLFQPIPAGKKFDLIVANPPYLPSNAATAAGDNFFSGGERGDALTLGILAGLEQRLEPGGVCQIIALWPQWRNVDFLERIRTPLGNTAPAYDLLFTVDSISIEGVITFGGPDVDPEFLRAQALRIDWGICNLRRSEKSGGAVVTVPFRAGAVPIAKGLGALAGPGSVSERQTRARALFG